MAEQQMAYPAYLSNNLSLLLGFILPLFLVLSFSFIVPPILKRIVYEKETGVKELMKLMGLPGWMHWLCWFINLITSCSISILIIVILVSVEFKSGTDPVLAFTDPSVTFTFIILYASALITFLFTISTFFDKRNYIIPLMTITSFCNNYSKLGSSSGCSCSHPHLLHPTEHHQQNL